MVLVDHSIIVFRARLHNESKKERNEEKQGTKFVVKWKKRIKAKAVLMRNVDLVHKEAQIEEDRVEDQGGMLRMIIVWKEERDLSGTCLEMKT